MFYICCINPRAKKKSVHTRERFQVRSICPGSLLPNPSCVSALMERDATAALNRAGTQYLCRSATFMNVQLNPTLHTPVNTDTSL